VPHHRHHLLSQVLGGAGFHALFLEKAVDARGEIIEQRCKGVAIAADCHARHQAGML
jgi:hypothetical protein